MQNKQQATILLLLTINIPSFIKIINVSWILNEQLNLLLTL